MRLLAADRVVDEPRTAPLAELLQRGELLAHGGVDLGPAVRVEGPGAGSVVVTRLARCAEEVLRAPVLQGLDDGGVVAVEFERDVLLHDRPLLVEPPRPDNIIKSFRARYYNNIIGNPSVTPGESGSREHITDSKHTCTQDGHPVPGEQINIASARAGARSEVALKG